MSFGFFCYSGQDNIFWLINKLGSIILLEYEILVDEGLQIYSYKVMPICYFNTFHKKIKLHL